MHAYFIRRVIQAVAVLIFLSFVTYGLMTLMPGDPLDIACASNPRCNPANIAEMKHQLGLDRPFYERYVKWIGTVARGDLGYSRTYKVPVTDILMPRLMNTFMLASLAVALSIFLAIPIGVFSSLNPNSKTDYLVNTFSFVGISVPSFWLGLMLIIIFSVKLNWFPASGIQDLGTDAVSWWGIVTDRLYHLVLPVTSLSLQTIASWVRYTRSSMMETMRHDFIRTARAKGAPERKVVFMHGLRNAILPVVTVIGLGVPALFSGSIITETVFAYPGLGKLLFDSIIGNDFNTAMCCFILGTTTVLFASLFVDLLYAYLDPRISLR